MQNKKRSLSVWINSILNAPIFNHENFSFEFEIGAAMTQISVAQVIAANKIKRFMIKYMKTVKIILLFLQDMPGFISNQSVSDIRSFLRVKLKFPSKSVQDAASTLIQEIEWENVNSDHDWDIVSIGENQ